MTDMADVAEQRPHVLGVIEVMNRSGQVVQRMPWSGTLLRVGRAYDNDLIISDPYVCPHHLELWSDSGRLLARDLNSVNGTYAGDSKERVDRLRLDDGATIHFGHCQLRYHASGSEVPPTRRDTARHGLLALLGKPALLVSASLLAIVSLVVDDLLDTPERLRLLTLASDLLYPLIGVVAWAGFWSLLNRVVSHRANFHVHLAISCLGVAGLFFIAQLVSVAGFALGWNDSVPWLKLLGRVGVLWMVIYGHLRYAVQGSARRQAVVAVTSALILFGTPEIGDVIERNEFSTLPYLDPLLRPPAYRLVQGETVEAFFAEARMLRARVDEAAEE